MGNVGLLGCARRRSFFIGRANIEIAVKLLTDRSHLAPNVKEAGVMKNVSLLLKVKQDQARY